MQPHEAADSPGTGTVMAASKINVRAAICFVVDKMSNPSLYANVFGRNDSIPVDRPSHRRTANEPRRNDEAPISLCIRGCDNTSAM